MRAHACDDARHAHLLTRRGFGQLPREVRHHLGQRIHHRAERVIGDVQADQLALPFQDLAPVGFQGALGEGDLVTEARMRPEHAHLPRIRGPEVRGADRQDLVEHGEHGAARAEHIQRAHLDQAFQRPLAHAAQVHPPGEVVDVAEGLVLRGLPGWHPPGLAPRSSPPPARSGWCFCRPGGLRW